MRKKVALAVGVGLVLLAVLGARLGIGAEDTDKGWYYTPAAFEGKQIDVLSVQVMNDGTICVVRQSRFDRSTAFAFFYQMGDPEAIATMVFCSRGVRRAAAAMKATTPE